MIHKAATLKDSRYLSAILVAMDSRPSSSPGTEEQGDKDGATALMLACQRENVDNVKTLLKRKVANLQSSIWLSFKSHFSAYFLFFLKVFSVENEQVYQLFSGIHIEFNLISSYLVNRYLFDSRPFM